MVTCAPDCKKDVDEHETFIMSVSKLLREGRRAGALPGTSNVELGFVVSVSSRRCMIPCVGKGVKEIMEGSRS